MSPSAIRSWPNTSSEFELVVFNPLYSLLNSYLDIFISKYSAKAVLAELARCLSLFENLHTVEIDFDFGGILPLVELFEATFKKYSYPQIRNVFIKLPIASFVASCPHASARRVGFTGRLGFSWNKSSLRSILDNCPHLEELDDIGNDFWTSDVRNRA